MTEDVAGTVPLGMPGLGRSPEAARVEELRAALVAAGASTLAAAQLAPDLDSGEEWLALEELLAGAEPAAMTASLRALAGEVALAVAGGWETEGIPDDGSPVTAPTPAAFVERSLAR